MNVITQLWDLIARINVHLEAWVREYPVAVYAILFLIIFCETGLVVMPFLPGDSLLFAVGAIAARPEAGLNVWLVSLAMLIAAILGDTLNYWIGRRFSKWMMDKFPRIVRQSHLDKTNAFFAKYGGKTIIIARFVPIVRTFAPFVAGSGHMNYGRFMYFNVTGAILWIGLLVPAGYIFGGYEIVKKNFELVIFAIIGISLLPPAVAWFQSRREMKRLMRQGPPANLDHDAAEPPVQP